MYLTCRRGWGDEGNAADKSVLFKGDSDAIIMPHWEFGTESAAEGDGAHSMFNTRPTVTRDGGTAVVDVGDGLAFGCV